MTESSNARPNSELRHCGDEIDLVDLFVALWRRKWIVIVVALLVTGIAVAYALLKQSKGALPQYTSIYALPAFVVSTSGGAAISGGQAPVVSPQEAMELAKQVFIPEAKISLDSNQAVNVENPKGTNLLVLASVAPKSDRKAVVRLHQKVIAKISAEIQDRIDSIKSLGGTAQHTLGKEVSGAARLFADQGRVVVLGQEGQPEGKSKTTLIIMLGAVLGFFAGVFAALVAGFIGSVRDRL